MTLRKTIVSLRNAIVLTPQEKAAAACVLGALLLGIATQQYRLHHPAVRVAVTPKARKAQKPAGEFHRESRSPKAPAQESDADDE